MEKKLHFKFSYIKYGLVFLLINIVSFTLVFSSMKNIKFAAPVDEGYYLKYATHIAENGVSGFPDLFKDYIQNNQNWLFPNPLRIGFITLSSIWLKLFGCSFLNLAYLSLFSFLIFLTISFYFVKKYFGRKIGFLFLTLSAFSPLNMAMARRALMDSTANLFMACAIWLFLESLREKKAYKTTLFVIIFAITILIKESSVLLCPFFILFLLVRRWFFKKPIRIIDFLSITLLPFIPVGAIYFLAAGGTSSIIATFKIIMNSPHFNEYAILYGSGPWFRYLIDFILLSPWTCILAIGFILYYVTVSKWQEEVLYLILLFISLVLLFVFLTKNVRYLIILDMPIRLFSVLMLNELTQRLFKDKAYLIIIVIVIIISIFDYSNFNYLFVRQGIYDPSSTLLLQTRHIIPWR